MKTKSSLLTDLSRALDGLAYADLGEYLPLQDKERVLGAKGLYRPANVSFEKPAPHYRRIALAVQQRVQPGALHYAHNACERLGADLDILTNLAEGGLRPSLDPERESLARSGHRLEVVRLGRDILRGVVHYARARAGLLFVVVSAEDGFAERVVSGFSESRGLDVPWVVVTASDAA